MHTGKPLIGITPQYDAEQNRTWIRSTYTNAVIMGGGIPVMLDQYTDETIIAEILLRLDGILLTGGVDLHPRLYGEAVDPMCGAITEVRDDFEARLFAHLADTQLPVLGICRGIQSQNVFLGGSLYQDIPNHSNTGHSVRIAAGTRLYQIFGKTEIECNSYHHQAVKTPAPGLIASAYAPDGTIEAIEMPGTRFFVGVQWHPELLSETEDHKKLFCAFAQAAAHYRASIK